VNPKEQNIIDTLNLLLLLFRAKKQSFPQLTEEQQHTLKVTKEHLAIAEISIPVFINTLNTLSEKGYLFAVSIFEDKFHSEIQKVLSDKNYPEILKQLENLDMGVFDRELKQRIADTIEKIKPANLELDRKELMEDEHISFASLISDGVSVLAGHTSNEVAIVTLMPFRSIERLLEKMNAGMKFDEVQDAGIWYDPKNFLFHIDEDTVSTSYQHKPNKEHFALTALLGMISESKIDYTDVPEFDDANDNEMRSYRDALKRFVEKHPRLSEIFTVHSDHLEIHTEYLEQTH